jgi:hypothetical protein
MALFAIRQVQHLGRTPGRKFVFAHILLPHPPYVLGQKGRRILQDEAASRPEAELFAEQLDYTNDLIKRTVASLLDGPAETDPIIVLSADEGPYLCGDDDCVDGTPETYGIRHGVLRAYYLPGLEHEVPADDSGVNIFRMLLREYFGADLPDLPNRSFTWPDRDHLYDFQEVTDILPLPGGPGARPPSEDYSIHTGEASPAPSGEVPGPSPSPDESPGPFASPPAPAIPFVSPPPAT